MANLMHRLIKNKSSLRVLTTLSTSKLAPSPAPHQTTPIGTAKSEYEANPRNPLFNHIITENVESTQPLRFYPCFPFGYCLNPIQSTGSDRLEVFEAEEVESSDAGMVYADSVKKKRKKKMNKHKYKKLRKRLRRKS